MLRCTHRQLDKPRSRCGTELQLHQGWQNRVPAKSSPRRSQCSWMAFWRQWNFPAALCFHPTASRFAFLLHLSWSRSFLALRSNRRENAIYKNWLAQTCNQLLNILRFSKDWRFLFYGVNFGSMIRCNRTYRVAKTRAVGPRFYI